ncbi:MAG: SLC13 family permease [Myxococcota bacterium]
MSLAALYASLVALATFAVLAVTRVPPHLVLAGGVAALAVAGVIGPNDALSGFANEGVITIGVLFVVAAGLKHTGAFGFVVYRLLGRPKTERGATIRLAGPVMVGSAFLNNTPVVAMLLPVVLDWCRVNRISPSRVLMPLSFLAILGGLCTLVGTSTSLAVHGLLVEQGHEPLSLFALTPIGVACALVGFAVILLAGPALLPDRTGRTEPFADPRRYSVEMVVSAKSPLAGKSVEEAGLRNLPGLFLAEIVRAERVLVAVEPTELLQTSDRLVFVGVVDSVADLQNTPGLEPATNQVFRLDAPRADRIFAEAVLSPRGPLIGKTIREGRFRNRYGAVVLAVSRGGERIPGRLGDITLRPGDTLFVESDRDFVDRWRNAHDFYLVSPLHNAQPIAHDRAPIALAILGAMVLLTGIGVLSLFQSALVAAAAMMATGCCPEHVARRSIDGPLLIALACAFGLGAGLEQTGVVALIGAQLLSISVNDAWLALALVYLVTTVLSEIVTNNAAAVIVFPIAVAVSESLSVSITPFALAVMIAANASFATPIGYQVNLMVYGPGGYRFGDFLKLGIPLKIAVAVVAIGLLPILSPF